MNTHRESTNHHSTSQWLEYQSHLAEVAELNSLQRAYRQAASEVLALRKELLDARLARQRSELAWQARSLARDLDRLDSLRSALRAIIRDVTDPQQVIARIEAKLSEI